MCSPFCDHTAPQTRPCFAKAVKGGYLLRFKKRLFGKSWREEWVVLYEDSTLAWYKEKGKLEPEGTIMVKEAPEMMAVAEWTVRIPGRPELPSGSHIFQLMAFPTRDRDKAHWFLAQSNQEVNDWMTAISNTLPPPPPPRPPPLLLPDNRDEPMVPLNPRLPSISFTTKHEAGHYEVSRGYGGQYIQPLAPENTLIIREQPDISSLMIAGALTNWGWGGGWGWGCQPHHHTTTNIIHNDITFETAADASYDAADYSMDCGDFGF